MKLSPSGAMVNWEPQSSFGSPPPPSPRSKGSNSLQKPEQGVLSPPCSAGTFSTAVDEEARAPGLEPGLHPPGDFSFSAAR